MKQDDILGIFYAKSDAERADILMRALQIGNCGVRDIILAMGYYWDYKEKVWKI